MVFWPNSPNWDSLVPLFRKFSAWNNILGDRCCHWHWAILNSNNLWSWLLNMTAKNVRSFKVSRLNLESWFWTSWCGVIWEQAGVLYNYMNVDKCLVQATSTFTFKNVYLMKYFHNLRLLLDGSILLCCAYLPIDEDKIFSQNTLTFSETKDKIFRHNLKQCLKAHFNWLLCYLICLN